jgi:hypothetical protein
VAVVVDFDDFHEHNNKLERLRELKRLNPLFRMTAFAVPALGSRSFWSSIPRWIELAVHGWAHPDAHECKNWGRDDIERVLDSEVVRKHFVNGWKSPGWQTSPAIYEVLNERGWWIADQHLADGLRPADLRVYLHEDGDNIHGHVQDWGSNGIEETWPQLVERIKGENEFRFASESARLNSHP